MNVLGPGVWVDDDGSLHVDLAECLRGNGYEANEQTRRMLETCWRDMAAQLDAEFVIEGAA